MAKGLEWAFMMCVSPVPGSVTTCHAVTGQSSRHLHRTHTIITQTACYLYGAGGKSKTYIPPREESDGFDILGRAELEKFGLKVCCWATIYYIVDENEKHIPELLEKDQITYKCVYGRMSIVIGFNDHRVWRSSGSKTQWLRA